MFIPFIFSSTKLSRRKGGGGRGGGGGGKAGKLSGKSSSDVTIGGGSTAKLYGPGGGAPYPSTSTNPLLTGRLTGGGTRRDIYGSSRYGSGYPDGIPGRGVHGKGFPFVFWPIVWLSLVSMAYLDAPEYGLPGSINRPGGVLISAAFKSRSTGTIYRLEADNYTVVALSDEVTSKCSTLIDDSNTTPVGNTSDSSQAQPEQAIQYYRASSIVLTLDGYNNSAVFGPEDAPNDELPNGIDTTLLDCLNNTIGEAAPLANNGISLVPDPVLQLTSIGLILLLSFVVS